MQLTKTLATLLLAASATAQWAQQATTTTPTSRTDAAMVFDLMRGQTVLFGGAAVTPLALRNDTWIYNGSDWTQATPLTSPTGRFGMSLAYDSTRNVSVFYGGMTSLISIATPNNQTWEWDGTNWTQILPVASPPRLAYYGIAYDSARQRVVVYGGSTNPNLFLTSNQTWEYDGATWTQVTTANNPGPRQFPGMCYHAALGRTIVFGGIDPQVGGNSNTWSYDGVNWTQVSVPVTPPAPRNMPELVYDTARAVCVMHGGSDPMTGAAINETWEFNGSLWQQVQTPVPSPRTRFAMAYDIFAQKVVMHGGIDGNTAMLDTHEYGANVRELGAGCAGSNGVPVLTGTNDPRLGSTFTTTLGSLANGAVLAALVSGFGAHNPALPLDGYGLTGCFSYTSIDAIVFLPVIGGVMTGNLAVPSDPGLFGLPLHQQGLSIDPGVNAAGLVVSNAITATIGW